MATDPANQFRCSTALRRGLVRDKSGLNGIDFLEVLDSDAIPLGAERQRCLLLHFLKPAPALAVANVQIIGGVRITPVKVLRVELANNVPAPPASIAERAWFAALPDADRVVAVYTDSSGDFSSYRLVVSASPGAPLSGIDPQLAQIEFGFKVECPSEFDCRPADDCPPAALTEPAIDYLAKDYASLRRLMLDRLTALMPTWRERNPADLLVTAVEALAYVGDRLSYAQDAVATEAYLGTARQRVSVRRHVRLLDYSMHEGNNARAWVCFEVTAGSTADGATLAPQTQLLTGGETHTDRSLDTAQRDELLQREQPLVFEAMEALTLRAAHNQIRFYTWSDEGCCLPRGATTATLLNDPPLTLTAGDVLLFEEVRGPLTGNPADADVSKRQAVRLVTAVAAIDPLDDTPVLQISWQHDDALAIALCLSARIGLVLQPDVSVARGNVVLADHGRTLAAALSRSQPSLLPDKVPARGQYRPRLALADITYAQRFDPAAARRTSAASALQQDAQQALPSRLVVSGDGQVWAAQRDLLSSGRFEADCVVEVADDRAASLRFGDGTLGREPSAGAIFSAAYRVGSGGAGNVGRETIGRVVSTFDGFERVRNPLPAQGGVEPESVAQVKLDAPQAFRTQERAVTEADWGRIALRHPAVQQAAARFRWTGSWYIVFIAIDRRGGWPTEREEATAFEAQMLAFFEPFRIAGYDLEIEPPLFVSLELVFEVCVAPGYFKANVKRALLGAFGSGPLPGGRRGFFHPDNFTFGDPLYLSRVYAEALRIDGVASIKATTFRRRGRLDAGELDNGVIRTATLEILQLANDVNFPENGKLEFDVVGGV